MYGGSIRTGGPLHEDPSLYQNFQSPVKQENRLGHMSSDNLEDNYAAQNFRYSDNHVNTIAGFNRNMTEADPGRKTTFADWMGNKQSKNSRIKVNRSGLGQDQRSRVDTNPHQLIDLNSFVNSKKSSGRVGAGLGRRTGGFPNAATTAGGSS